MMRQVFNEIDIDGSGFIDRNELNNFLIGFAELMGAEPPDEKALNMTLKILDENEDGKISFNGMAEVLENLIKIVLGEFDQEYQTMQYQELLQEEEKLTEVASAIFVQYDKDGSGFIEAQELAQFMISVAEALDIPPPTAEEVVQALK